MASRDHPRTGGEKAAYLAGLTSGVGSPPRGRGKDGESTGIGGADGITPAWAGKSMTAPGRSSRTGDHPRACGEKNKELEGVWLPMGSPPRRRGKVHLHPDAAKQRGITPAWAGKRQPTPASTTASQDHPRVGGEKVGMMKVWWEV